MGLGGGRAGAGKLGKEVKQRVGACGAHVSHPFLILCFSFGLGLHCPPWSAFHRKGGVSPQFCWAYVRYCLALQYTCSGILIMRLVKRTFVS